MRKPKISRYIHYAVNILKKETPKIKDPDVQERIISAIIEIENAINLEFFKRPALKNIRLKDIPIDDTRTTNFLKNRFDGDCDATLYDLAKTDRYDLLSAKNFGKNSLDKLNKALEPYGLEI